MLKRCLKCECPQELLAGSGAFYQLWSACTGVLHTHGSLAAQMSGMQQAWGWRQEDAILHTLPLHHIHGIVNALLCAHAASAAIEFLPKFSPSQAWESLQVSSASKPPAPPPAPKQAPRVGACTCTRTSMHTYALRQEQSPVMERTATSAPMPRWLSLEWMLSAYGSPCDLLNFYKETPEFTAMHKQLGTECLASS